MQTFFREIFSQHTGIYRYRNKVKFSQNWKKDEKDSSLHRIPNLIVSIFVLHDPGGSHATMAKILRHKGIVSQKQVIRP